VLTLQTLGGVSVVDEQGQPLTGAASQRRLLALLLVLALAGERGLSRDKLIALLWPDAGEERARHSLTQALYAARRALKAEDLFEGKGDLRLNGERLQSDVRELEQALAVGDDERAAALYAGPFADGFYLPGCGEFEQWTSSQRARLEDGVIGALERLARQAEGEGRPRDAVEWRKRLAGIRPLDAATAVGLMTSLAYAGDRAGALQHARLHETLLREELGLQPDPVVASLAARLREPVDWAGPAPAPVAGLAVTSADPAGGTGGAAALSEWRTVTTTTAPLPPVAEPGRRVWRARFWVLAAAGLTLALAILLYPTPTPDAPAPAGPPAPLEQSVVVAPFRVAGASASLAYLREGMVELLSTRLADDSESRSVDAGAVLTAWRAANLNHPAEVPRGDVVRLAAGLGAERVVVGSVVGTPSRVVITAAVVDVGSQWTSGEATVEGPADSITALVDRLAARILLVGSGEDVTLSYRTTESLRALRVFLAGQAAFRRGRYPVALRHYEDAVTADSTFALAALQLARTADRLHLTQPRTRALALAWRERGALDARARSLLVALAGPRYPEPSDPDELVAAWERLVTLTPDRAESWFELGDRLAREGGAAALVDAPARARVVLRRSLGLDSTYVPARELLAQLEDPEATTPTPADSSLPLEPFLHWRSAVMTGDSASVRGVRNRLPELGPRNLRAIAATALAEAISVGDARRAVRQLLAKGGRLEDQVDAVLADHALALNEGRLRDAEDAAIRLAELQPGTHAHLRLRVLDALYGDGDTTTAETAIRVLERRSAPRPGADPSARAVELADACVTAQWRLHRNDTTGVRGAIERLRADSLAASLAAPPLAAGSVACSELLQAWLAVTLMQPDAGRTVARLDSLAFTAAPSGDAVMYAPVLIARLHLRLGDPRAAAAGVRRRANEAGWPRYMATVWKEEGQYALAVGAIDEAREAFRRYLVLRSKPDPELRAEVERVRRLFASGEAAP
jgi:DNA-binding SARP family transcriptional activator/TolB-like protein